MQLRNRRIGNEMMDELIELVKEWRDARQVIFDSQPQDDRTKLFAHLALCEYALMDAARKLQ